MGEAVLTAGGRSGGEESMRKQSSLVAFGGSLRIEQTGNLRHVQRGAVLIRGDRSGGRKFAIKPPSTEGVVLSRCPSSRLCSFLIFIVIRRTPAHIIPTPIHAPKPTPTTPPGVDM